MARKTATVMHMAKDFRKPPLHGIWGKVELPALREKTDIEVVRSAPKSNSSKRVLGLSNFTWNR